jgi:formylglycine-generating enzyme required for sulfatase activity
MVELPGGTFWMGSPDTDAEAHEDEKPQHEVTVSAFAISRYPIIRELYRKLCDTLPEAWQRDSDDNRLPANNVSWFDAVSFCNTLSQQVGLQLCYRIDGRQVAWDTNADGYRLPTEAEWEYAARAGTETTYWWGNDIKQGLANCRTCGSKWDGKSTAPVGSFKPNAFGLFDTSGNVSEWVQDCRHENYQGAPSDGSAWEEKDSGDCGVRGIRGGMWLWAHNNVRSSVRFWNRPSFSGRALGFRLVREVE